ncbi:ABC transporter permease [Hominiventricola filiformis]|uniref:ABC transporter permease n=1 Tax=Hominiventricola filiformis TaxID=2885352 RepID=A0AAE3A7Z6_9FIRM|nr:ABC transporter permease [Hominiventricola filiformis]MCC2125515.1 ABC transporter permease [Hominiventricola filiformis]
MLWRYILKRIGQTFIVLFAVSILSFVLIRLAPGNPAMMVLGDSATVEDIAAMEAKLGLDQPLVKQYITYIVGVLHGDLGTSIIYNKAVSSLVISRFFVSLKISMAALAFSLIISIPIAILAGTHQGKFIDFFAMAFAVLGQSMPTVWLGILNILVFAVFLGIFPAFGYEGPMSLVLPAMTLGYPFAAVVTRMGRSGMIDVLREDYITATIAKGIPRHTVYMKYAFKNAMIPIVTLVGMQIGHFLGGAVVCETMFGMPGIGQLLNLSVGNRDYFVVQALLLLIATAFAVLNLLVDIVNALIDPRIRLQ